MSTCSIEIKIKDYFPKTDSIPYQNFICLFTNGESEGQIPLISKDNESYKHQIKNVSSDIKYKIHVLDYNDMSLIGMCEMVISYNVISQITPPNGFIQEQQKKLLMDTNTKRKLFGTVINIGDIYLNIFSEIYLCETKNNINNTKSNCRKKNQLFEGVSRKKIDGSPRTVRKKQLMMQINSDRRALININKNGNNNLEKKQKYKNLTTNNKIDKNMTSINNPNNNNTIKVKNKNCLENIKFPHAITGSNNNINNLSANHKIIPKRAIQVIKKPQTKKEKSRNYMSIKDVNTINIDARIHINEYNPNYYFTTNDKNINLLSNKLQTAQNSKKKSQKLIRTEKKNNVIKKINKNVQNSNLKLFNHVNTTKKAINCLENTEGRISKTSLSPSLKNLILKTKGIANLRKNKINNNTINKHTYKNSYISSDSQKLVKNLKIGNS